MGELSTISGIGKTSLDLLGAVGISSPEELAAQDAESLTAELERANKILLIKDRPPSKRTVKKWIADAKKAPGGEPVAETPAAEPKIRIPVNYEANPEVAEMLSRAPCAIPLPGRIMMEKGLAVGDVTPGILLNRYSGDLDVRVDDSGKSDSLIVPRRPSGNMETIEIKDGRRQIEVPAANLKSSPTGVSPRIPKSRSIEKDDRISRIRAPDEETNRGKDPASRTFVRGVLHPHPWRLRIAALFSILLVLNLPLGIAAAILLLLSRENPGSFPWVREWFLVFPAVLPLVGIGYMIWGQNGKCRVCCQKLFVHQRAHKHIKSHHVPGFGYVVPLSLHLLTFSWFRCSSCGTPVRLKK